MAESAPECPRCAYDLSGLVASWGDCCPLQGLCSECGLEFEWRYVLNPSFNVPRWSYEHARLMSPIRWAGTMKRALWPPGFWASLRLEHRVRVGRLLASIVAVLLLVHVTVAGTAVWQLYMAGAAALPSTRGTFVLPNPPRRVQQHPTVMRIFGESIVDAALWPYRPRLYLYGPGGSPMWGGVASPVLGVWALFIAGFWVAVAPGFLALGETMRRCRVRKAHLVRGVAYSMAGPLLVLGAAMVGAAIAPAPRMAGKRLLDVGETIHTGAVAAACVWLCLYWTVFVVRYLRLTHAWWVAASMLVIGGLFAMLVTTLGWLASMGNLW